MENIYIKLTREFNIEKVRAIICSGQAVVLHRLAIMSKDGDWILREDQESLSHVLDSLGRHNSRYRFGAPLDLRWMRGGWSSHFEFRTDGLRVRTDFFTKPPRLNLNDRMRMWEEHEGNEVPYVNAQDLARIKKTNREKDYVVIGELARIMIAPEDQLLFSRSARDILDLAENYPDLIESLSTKRSVLSLISEGREKLEIALDAERRQLMQMNEDRLNAYSKASEEWARIWPDLSKQISDVPLRDAHEIIVDKAVDVLPDKVDY